MRQLIFLFMLPLGLIAQVLGPFGNNQHIGAVGDMIVYKGKLFIGGANKVNNVGVGGTATYDGTTTAAFGGGQTNAFTIHNNELYLAGIFGGQIQVKKWDGTTLSNATSAISINTSTQWLGDLEIYNGDIYLGGYFEVNNQGYALAKYNGANWSYHGTIKEQRAALSLNLFGGELKICGLIDTLNGTLANGVVSFDGSNWSSMNSGPPNSFLGYSSIVENQKWVVAGRNWPLAGSAIYEWDGINWQAISFPGLTNSSHSSVHLSDGNRIFEIGFTDAGNNAITKAVLYVYQNGSLTQLSDTCWVDYFSVPAPFWLFNGVVKFQNQWLAYGSFSHITPNPGGTLCPFIASVNGILSTSSSFKDYAISLYPNPTRHYLKLEGVEEGSAYKILDERGLLIYEGTYQQKINIEPLPTGVYILSIGNEVDGYRQKFIKID